MVTIGGTTESLSSSGTIHIGKFCKFPLFLSTADPRFFFFTRKKTGLLETDMGNVTQIGQVDVAVAVQAMAFWGPRVVIQSMGNPAMFFMFREQIL